jgi:flagellar protein FlaI
MVREFSAVNASFGYSIIIEDPLLHVLNYEVVEPTLSSEEKGVFDVIQNYMAETLDVILFDVGSDDEAKQYLRQKVKDIINTFRIKLDEKSLDKLLYYFTRDYLGYGVIDVMMKDPMIEDISCNGENVPLYIWHRKYESIPSNVSFTSAEQLNNFIIRLAYRTGKMISISNPVLDGALPDGSRINMTLGKEVTRHGSTFTIRKFREDPLTIIDMIMYNTVSSDMAALFWFFVEHKFNIFVCGPTASGKTTLLNTYLLFIKPDYKIVTIEDTPELKLYHKNWIRSISRPSLGASSKIDLFDLLKAAMRQRPDYIIVGEVRGEEASTLFQAIATGHGGLSTLHAESVLSAVHRLETTPMNIPRSLIPSLNIITIQQRFEREGKPIRRTVTATEIIGLDPQTNEILTNEIFRYDASTDTYRFTGRSYLLEKIANMLGKTLREIRSEIERRQSVLNWMVKKELRSFQEVAEVIREYYNNPDEVIKQVRVEK